MEDQAEAGQAAAGNHSTSSTSAVEDALVEDPDAASNAESNGGATSSGSETDSDDNIVGLSQADIDAMLQEHAELTRERMPPEGSAVAYGHKGKDLPSLHPSARQRLLGYQVGPLPPGCSSCVLVGKQCQCLRSW